MNNSEVIGFLSYMIIGRGKYIHLEALRISPNYGNMGLGSQFQEMAQNFMKQQFPSIVIKNKIFKQVYYFT